MVGYNGEWILKSVTRTYKGRSFTMHPAPSDVLNGNKRLLECQALSAVNELDYVNNVAPCKWIIEWVEQMKGFSEQVYVPALEGHPMDECEFMAKFKDGSCLIWLGAYKEWGFRYGVELSNPFVDVFASSPDTGSSHIDPSEEEGVQCG